MSNTEKPTNSLHPRTKLTALRKHARKPQADGKLEAAFRQAVRALAKLEQTNVTDGDDPTYGWRSWEGMWGSIPLNERLRKVFDRCRSERKRRCVLEQDRGLRALTLAHTTCASNSIPCYFQVACPITHEYSFNGPADTSMQGYQPSNPVRGIRRLRLSLALGDAVSPDRDMCCLHSHSTVFYVPHIISTPGSQPDCSSS